jgi:hypothetical protein
MWLFINTLITTPLEEYIYIYIYDTFPKACQMVLSIVFHYENKMEFFWTLGV